jgi:hypothetical protein
MDRSGRAIATPVADLGAIGAIRLTLLAPARRRVAAHAQGATVDTTRVVVRLRVSRP